MTRLRFRKIYEVFKNHTEAKSFNPYKNSLYIFRFQDLYRTYFLKSFVTYVVEQYSYVVFVLL